MSDVESFVRLLRTMYDSRQFTRGTQANRVIQLAVQPRDAFSLNDQIGVAETEPILWDGVHQWSPGHRWGGHRTFGSATAAATGSPPQAVPVTALSWVDYFSPDLWRLPIAIPSGQSATETIDLNGAGLVGLILPTSWTSASVTIQVAASAEGTLRDLYDDRGEEVQLPARPGSALHAKEFMNVWQFVKFRSGKGASHVNQEAERTIWLLAKKPVRYWS